MLLEGEGHPQESRVLLEEGASKNHKQAWPIGRHPGPEYHQGIGDAEGPHEEGEPVGDLVSPADTKGTSLGG